ncbi:carbohydrate-binding protein [Faecalibaculum rodentium]|uniref:carbohydrate-binding protein n=6 Tax=Faecalibaculum rodentium TaxID=1702221 RepID=UPI002599C944|nr:carbohydrate-binding protein [Faecalibaculum rodentium]
MKIYVQISGDGAVTAFSTCSTADVQVDTEVTGPLYPEKISGYKLEPDNTGVNHLVFDEAQYKAHLKQEQEAAAKAEAEAKLAEVSRDALLAGVDDDTALTMAPLYDAWEPGVDYKTGQRLRFGDGGFVKVLQDHKSQEDWEPGKTPSLYAVIANPAIEWPPYKQPTGAHDAYMAGDKVTFDGERYICKRDNVSHSPAELPDAWEKAAD